MRHLNDACSSGNTAKEFENGSRAFARKIPGDALPLWPPRLQTFISRRFINERR